MTKKIIIGVVLLIVLFTVIGASSSKTETATKKETTVSAQKTDLGPQVQKAYLDNIGYKSIAELNLDSDNLVGKPANEIVSFTDKGAGQVQVEVQDNITKQQATSIALSVVASASDVSGLKTVFVHGINGTISYANASTVDK